MGITYFSNLKKYKSCDQCAKSENYKIRDGIINICKEYSVDSPERYDCIQHNFKYFVKK